jgi:bifunctional DNase/RNase
VLVEGAEGRREVDARPSDAVTLALTAGAPIRVDGALFDLPVDAEKMADLAASPVVTADLAAENARRIY